MIIRFTCRFLCRFEIGGKQFPAVSASNVEDGKRLAAMAALELINSLPHDHVLLQNPERSMPRPQISRPPPKSSQHSQSYNNNMSNTKAPVTNPLSRAHGSIPMHQPQHDFVEPKAILQRPAVRKADMALPVEPNQSIKPLNDKSGSDAATETGSPALGLIAIGDAGM